MDPKFDLSLGTGTPIRELTCITGLRRGKDTKAAEAAIEPLHRYVYGRPGQTGERIRNLSEFKGFPEDMRTDVLEKLKNLTVAKLRDLIKVLAMPVLLSQNAAALADGVLSFLMHPEEKRQTAKPAPARPKRDRQEEDAAASAAPVPRVAKTEPATSVCIQQPSSMPTEDAVRVAVYRRVLSMSLEERRSLGVKALRMELEASFGLPEGGLRGFKEAIKDTASGCVQALLEAEMRATASVPSGAVA